MEKRINILNLKSKMVRISSEDKTKNSVNNSRFEVNLNQTGANIDRVAGYAVKHISCPNIFYNVPAYANTLEIIKQTGNITYNILVDPNQYNLNDFILELQTAINTAINPDTVTITANNKNYLNFVFVGDNYKLIYENSTISKIIGLIQDTPFFSNLTLSNPVNLTGETELYIHSKTLNPAGLVEPSGAFAVVDVVPLSVPFGAVAYSNFNDLILHEKPYIPYESLRTFRTVDIVLRNRAGNVLELPDNFYFNMVLIIYYE